MEKTAIELLKNLANATKMLIRDAEVVNSYYEQNDYAEHEMPLGSPNPDSVPIESRKCSEIIADIDAYLSSPPSERAMNLAENICRRHLSFEEDAREIEAFGQGWIPPNEISMLKVQNETYRNTIVRLDHELKRLRGKIKQLKKALYGKGKKYKELSQPIGYTSEMIEKHKKELENGYAELQRLAGRPFFDTEKVKNALADLGEAEKWLTPILKTNREKIIEITQALAMVMADTLERKLQAIQRIEDISEP